MDIMRAKNKLEKKIPAKTFCTFHYNDINRYNMSIHINIPIQHYSIF